MSLENIYIQNVAGKGQVNYSATGIPVARERDTRIIALEHDVFGKINNIINNNKLSTINATKVSTSHVSFEDAIKELQLLTYEQLKAAELTS